MGEMDDAIKVKVGLGLALLPFASRDGFWRWVDLCEAGDVDSLWQSDRLISPQPYLEAMSTMAALAGRTERMKFGMSVVVVSFRDPLVLAKECATIDWLSGGRFLPAFGVGAARAPEWNAAGFEPRDRGRRADEALRLMVRLWSEDEVSFSGEFYDYTDACISPRPLQDPLPLWIGGSSAAAIRRTVEVGTGWIAGIQTPEQVAPVVEKIRRAGAASGRPIPEDHYGAGFSYRFGSWNEPIVQRTASLFSRFSRDLDPERYLAVGEASDVLARIEDYKKAGVSKFVLRPVAADERELFYQTERLLAEVLPVVQGR